MAMKWIMRAGLVGIVSVSAACNGTPDYVQMPAHAVDPVGPPVQHAYDKPAYMKGSYWVPPTPHADRTLPDGR